MRSGQAVMEEVIEEKTKKIMNVVYIINKVVTA